MTSDRPATERERAKQIDDRHSDEYYRRLIATLREPPNASWAEIMETAADCIEDLAFALPPVRAEGETAEPAKWTDGPYANSPSRFDCLECMMRGIAVDEDGCCKSCGHDAERIGLCKTLHVSAPVRAEGETEKQQLIGLEDCWRREATEALTHESLNPIQRAAVRHCLVACADDLRRVMQGQSESCEHGTAWDVHCCNCHSGFIFDMKHECPAPVRAEEPTDHEDWATFLAAWVDYNCGSDKSELAWREYQDHLHRTPPVRGCRCKVCAAALPPVQEPVTYDSHGARIDFLASVNAVLRHKQVPFRIDIRNGQAVEVPVPVCLSSTMSPVQEPPKRATVLCPQCKTEGPRERHDRGLFPASMAEWCDRCLPAFAPLSPKIVQEPPNHDNWFDRQADGAAKAYEELPKWLKPDASPSQGVRLADLKALVAVWREKSAEWWRQAEQRGDLDDITTNRLKARGSQLVACADELSAALEGANTKGGQL